MVTLPAFLKNLFTPGRFNEAGLGDDNVYARFTRAFHSGSASSGNPRTTSPVKLPALILGAHPLAVQLQSGRHGRRRSGDGEEFWQFRPYEAHEPASAIDWRQSARAPDPETLWVREREQKAPRSLLLWVDPSPSMAWRSSDRLSTKREAALTEALALGEAALQAGERVGVAGKGKFYTGLQALPRLAADLAGPALASPAASGLPPVDRLPPHAQLLLVSDFLWETGEMDAVLASCGRRPGRTALLGVLDPAERNLPYNGRLRFSSPESDTPLTLPAVENLHEDYKREMDARLERLAHAPGRGLRFRLHQTDASPLPPLMALHDWLGGRA